MKVLVTGSHGYIGTVLVPMLNQKGHEVAANAIIEWLQTSRTFSFLADKYK